MRGGKVRRCGDGQKIGGNLGFQERRGFCDKCCLYIGCDEVRELIIGFGEDDFEKSSFRGDMGIKV